MVCTPISTAFSPIFGQQYTTVIDTQTHVTLINNLATPVQTEFYRGMKTWGAIKEFPPWPQNTPSECSLVTACLTFSTDTITLCQVPKGKTVLWLVRLTGNGSNKSNLVLKKMILECMHVYVWASVSVGRLEQVRMSFRKAGHRAI